MSNTHGGPRAGAGRKPGSDPTAAHRTRRLLLLSDAEYQQAKALGQGNASAGVRAALAAMTAALAALTRPPPATPPG